VIPGLLRFDFSSETPKVGGAQIILPRMSLKNGRNEIK
jgi:hypothetical protein